MPPVGEGTTATGKPTGAPRATKPDGARRTTRDHEARCRPQPRHTDRCQATTSTGCRKPGKRAKYAMNYGTGKGARQHSTVKNNKPQPGMAGRSQIPNQNTHTHTAHPSQEWQATGGPHTQTHMPQHPSQDWLGEIQNRNRHIRTTNLSRDWRGTGRACTQTHTPQHSRQ